MIPTMRHYFSKQILLVMSILMTFTAIAQEKKVQNQTSKNGILLNTKSNPIYSENGHINPVVYDAYKKQTATLLKASNINLKDFFVNIVSNPSQLESFKKFLGGEIGYDQRALIIQIGEGKIKTKDELTTFIAGKTQKYKKLFKTFEANQKETEQINANLKKDVSNGVLPFSPGRAPGQPCQNMDFETQSLTAWVGSYGSGCDPIAIAGFNNLGNNSATGQHTIMTGGTDTNVPAIPCVMPGGTASLRLGDDGGGFNWAARISQTFQVQAANPYFTYNYAVVLEDAGHVLAEQPYFRIRMYDGSNNLIDCATLDVDATNAPGLTSTATLKYKNWTQVVIPLTSFVGQNVRIEFTTADCNNGPPTGGSHDGYAYIDCSCVPPQIFTSSPTICGGTNINVTAPSGLSSYSWSGPGIVGANNAQTVVVNQAGLYTVTMQTNTTAPNIPCTFTLDTIIPGNPASPVAQFISSIVCQGAPTVFTDQSTPVGSINAWAWDFDNNGSTDDATQNPTHVFPAAGSFPVNLTVTWGGCTDNFTGTVTVNPGVAPTITPAGPFCVSAAPSNLASNIAGGVWSGTGITNSAAGTFDPALATIGNNTITYTVAGACAGSTTSVVVVNPLPISNAGPDITICSATTGNLGAATTAGYNYLWTPGTGLSSTAISNPTVTLTNATATPVTSTYNVVTTIAATGCTSNDNVDVTVNPIATVNAGPAQTICIGSTATMAGTIGGSAASGTWSGGTGTYAPSASALNAVYTPSAAEEAAGTVTLTLSTDDPAGPCPQATATVTITINPVATIAAGPDQTICIGNSATLAGTIGGSTTTGTWTGGAGAFVPSATTPAATYTPTAAEEAAGTVTLTFTSDDPAGPCPSVSDQMILTIAALPAANAGLDQTICDGSTANLAGSISGAATSGTWSGGAGTFAPSATALNATYTPTAAEGAAGTVTLTLTTNDPAGPCTFATDQMIITINPVATINAGPDQTICIGTTATLAGIIGGSASSGTWSGGAGAYAPSAATANAVYTPTATENAAGTVTLTFTSDDPVGPCGLVSDNMTITINQLPTANAGVAQSVCSGGTITLGGSIGGSATSGTWSGGTGTYFPSNTALNAVYTPSAAEYAAGTFTLQLTTNDPAGPCSFATSSVTHIIYQNPVVNFVGDVLSGCPVHCVQFTDATTVGGGDNIVAWDWNFHDGSLDSIVQNPYHCFVNSGYYDITLTATSNHGCSTTMTLPAYIHVFEVPTAEFTPNPNPATVLDPTITMNNGSTTPAPGSITYYNYYFGDGDSVMGISSPTHVYPNETSSSYMVTLIVQNNDGCWDTVQHEVFIGPEFTFFIPNAFTPNGDGVNDFFNGAGIGIIEYDLWIFDRWGNMIFHSESTSDDWNGKANGGQKIAQQDVYVWKVKLKDVFNKTHNYIGTVTLVK